MGKTVNRKENQAFHSHLDPWIRRLRSRLEEGFGSSVQVILFGSYARGEAAPDSDVDLLVVVPRLDKQAMDLILEAAWEASFEAGVVFSVIPITADELRLLAESPFLRTVQREGILL